MKISSTFALLDVKTGRGKLAKSTTSGNRHAVTISGFVLGPWGSDDGESLEFIVDVTGLELGPAEENTDA